VFRPNARYGSVVGIGRRTWPLVSKPLPRSPLTRYGMKLASATIRNHYCMSYPAGTELHKSTISPRDKWIRKQVDQLMCLGLLVPSVSLVCLTGWPTSATMQSTVVPAQQEVWKRLISQVSYRCVFLLLLQTGCMYY